MYTFSINTLMYTSLHIWLVAVVIMFASKIISAVMKGLKQGRIIAEIKTNVNNKLAEIDDDMQKYYDYEVETNDKSDMHEQNERE